MQQLFYNKLSLIYVVDVRILSIFQLVIKNKSHTQKHAIKAQFAIITLVYDEQ